MDSLRKRSILMKYHISRRSTSSVNGFDHQPWPDYSTGSWRCSMTGVIRYPVPLSIHPASPDNKTIPENLNLRWYGSTDYHWSENLSTLGPWYPEKLLKQCHRTRPSDLYVMDKGYDSEDIHELIHDTLNSCSLIPIRNRKRKRISGYYRRRLALSFDDEKYHQRNKVETVFSVMKKRFGEALKARIYRLQIKEIKIKVILYNLSRSISTLSFLILTEEFYRAKKISMIQCALKCGSVWSLLTNTYSSMAKKK